MRILLLIACAVWLVTLSAEAAVTSGLMQAYHSLGVDERVPAIIVLHRRVVASGLEGEMNTLGLSLAERHTRLMDTLKVRALLDQPTVMRSLDILKSSGMAANVQPFWISNLIAADLTRAAAELIANMSEVDEVGLDERVQLRSSVESSVENTPVRINVEPNLRRIGVRDAWAQGYLGEGRVGCVLGEGVNKNHPQIASRWRGTSAGEEQAWFSSFGERWTATNAVPSTRLLGVLCGADRLTADTIGVAPGANWIAAQAFRNGESRLSKILLALQWAADPDLKSSTLADVPDAIVCPMDMSGECGGPAPAAVWEAFDNVEALGPVIVFPIDQQREGGLIVGNPESRPRAFSVGNVDVTGTALIHPSSGRGPSPCDIALVKPDVVAPGTRIRTAEGNGYSRVTGTDVAAAQVAGAILLLRQANPSLTATSLKRILMTTAEDLGSPAADNTYGAGLINVTMAVQAALASGKWCTIQGSVQYGGELVSGARAVLSSAYGDIAVSTRYDGIFVFDHIAAERNYQLKVGRFGFRYYLKPESLRVETGGVLSVLVELTRGFDDDCEYDQGWLTGLEGDNATSGVWVRAIPVGSMANGKEIQPSKAHSGDYCFLTGNAGSAGADAAEADVDGGRTTLRSPLFSLMELEDPVLHFAYWYSNDQGSSPGGDFFKVQISNDAGRNWVNLINTASATDGWSSVSVRVADFVAPSSRMLLQFIAEDAGPGSLVEAAVDDIKITGTPSVPEPPRDLMLDVQFDQVVLRWRASTGATQYRVYLSPTQERIISPENFFTATRDTTLTVPLSDIRFNEFYFQVTAVK